jgi:hypothetical protein
MLMLTLLFLLALIKPLRQRGGNKYSNPSSPDQKQGFANGPHRPYQL